MQPAPSLLLFSTLSGAGYGLLFVLGLAVLLGIVPPAPLPVQELGRPGG